MKDPFTLQQNIEFFRYHEDMYTRPYLKGKNLENIVRKASAYYDAHQEEIDKGQEGYNIISKRRSFIAGVVERMNEKKQKKYRSYKEALKKEIHSYSDKETIFKENALSGIKIDRDEYERWRKFTRHQKIDFDKFVYLKDEGAYRYETPKYWVMVKFTNSPTEVRVWRIAK